MANQGTNGQATSILRFMFEREINDFAGESIFKKDIWKLGTRLLETVLPGRLHMKKISDLTSRARSCWSFGREVCSFLCGFRCTAGCDLLSSVLFILFCSVVRATC